MAYDRNDTRGERARWPDDRNWDRDRGRSPEGRFDRGRDDGRGFFERAGDEIASWFGDDEAERRRHDDPRRGERERGYGPPPRDREYRPMAGDYGRSEPFVGRSERDFDRSQAIRDDGRRTAQAGAFGRSRHEDPHYNDWRQRHLDELDRDYDDYRRENQSRFESDFGSWRERRQQKRGLLDTVREHMEVVGSDEQHVGTVDKVAGDRLILTRSDPDSGGARHSLSCADVDRIDGDRVILDCTADKARERWRDETRSRALFEREDQGEMGPRMLDRSFEGTYR